MNSLSGEKESGFTAFKYSKKKKTWPTFAKVCPGAYPREDGWREERDNDKVLKFSVNDSYNFQRLLLFIAALQSAPHLKTLKFNKCRGCLLEEIR